MLRWRGRLLAALTSRSDAALDGDTFFDFTYAFFQSCYHLRDWLAATKASSGEDLAELFKSSKELQLCRDICNASKHLQYDRPSIDPRPRISQEYDPWTQEAAGWFVYSDQRRPIGELVEGCVAAWDEYLSSKGLLAQVRR